MDRKRSLVIIAVATGTIVLLAFFLNFLPFTKHTSTASKPVFSVTLSPLKQTVHTFANQTEASESGYTPAFYLTVAGNATYPVYPCGVVIWGGLFPEEYYQPFSIDSNSHCMSHGGVPSSNYPISVNGNSNTFWFSVSTLQNNGTATYYVSVTDSLGNSVNSNKVQVVFKIQK
jgi:hypothetical protein